MAFFGSYGSRDRRGWTPRPGWGRDWREGGGGGAALQQQRGLPGGWGTVHHHSHHNFHLRQEKDYFGLFGSDKVDVEPRPDPFFFPNYSEPPPLPDKTGLFPDFSQPPPLTGNLEMPEERASTSSGSQKRRCREYDADEAEEEVAAANKKPKLSDSKYLLSFKGFLETQNDHITEEESLAMYRDYKAEYRRQRMLEFFEEHKEEEWMMELYHPVCKERRRLEDQARVTRRSDVFWSMFENEICGLKLEAGQEEKLINMMDTFVLKLGKVGREVTSGSHVVKSEPLLTLDETVEPSPDLVDGDLQEKALHHPVSLFLPQVPLSVPASLVEQLGRKCRGFQRVALGPVNLRGGGQRHTRKAWITYEANTNIKQVCVSLSGSKLGGIEVDPMVNRPLSKRIRQGQKLAGHKQVMRRDLKLASELVRKLDARQDDSSESKSKNFLKTAAELLLMEGKGEEKAEESGVKLMQCLDSILIYLRVVHSIDWYNGVVYKEDRMPNRLGILHVRPVELCCDVSEAEIKTYLDNMQLRIDQLAEEKRLLSEEEVIWLGGKTEEQELEMFFKANVEELSKDKWLCKLSGKKFRSFEFVKKHMVNKFPGKVKQVRMEVEFLKNFLADPDRPALPETSRPSKVKSTEEKEDKEWAKEKEEITGSMSAILPHTSVSSSKSGPLPMDGRRGFHSRGFYLEPQPLPDGEEVRDDPRQTVDYGDIETLLEMPHFKRPCPW